MIVTYVYDMKYDMENIHIYIPTNPLSLLLLPLVQAITFSWAIETVPRAFNSPLLPFPGNSSAHDCPVASHLTKGKSQSPYNDLQGRMLCASLPF